MKTGTHVTLSQAAMVMGIECRGASRGRQPHFLEETQNGRRRKFMDIRICGKYVNAFDRKRGFLSATGT